jgi:hypothetical protein
VGAFVLVAALALAVGAGAAILAQHDWGSSTTTSSGTRGSGVAATATRDVAPFTGVELAGSSNVNVAVGGQQRVVVRADDNLIQRVTTRVNDGTLVIGTRGSFSAKTPMIVDVTVPKLNKAVLAGSGIVAVEGVRGRTFTALTPGSGILRVSGSVDRLGASLEGSGDMQLADLVAVDATAVVSGSGRILVHATESLDASVSGSGAIFYGGNPASVTRDVTGSGAIIGQ